jgi:phytoene synthase
MRQCDDISDNEGSVEEKRERFARWRALFEEAMQGGHANHPTLPALRDTVQAFHIPIEYFRALIDGTEMDLAATRYATFDDLYCYCYRVASVVGLVCICIFEFKEEEAKQRAEACGIAFQLTNILRDIKEDLQRNRVYIPLEDMLRFEYTEDDLRHEVMDERFRKLMKFEAERAQSYYASGRPLTGLIEKDSRPAFRTMYGTYETILRRIEQRNYDVLSKRVRLRPDEKMRILFESLVSW